MADLSKLVLNGSEYNLKDSAAREKINEIDGEILKKRNDDNIYSDYFYISPNGYDLEESEVEEGSDHYGDGTIDHPFFSVNKVMDYFQNNFVPNFTGTPDRRNHEVVIIAYPGTYNYTEQQIVSTLYMHSVYSGSVKIQAMNWSTISEKYVNYTPEQIDALNPETEDFPIFDFSGITKNVSCFEILTSCFMFGICIKGNSRALTCYDELYSRIKINGVDQHSEYIRNHGLAPWYSSSCIAEHTNGMLDIRNCILMNANVGLNLYKNGFYNYVRGDFLKIQDCDNCFSLYGNYPLSIECKNLVFNTFRNAFTAGTKITNGATHLNCINLLAKEWNYGAFISRYASVELIAPDEYNGLYTDGNNVLKSYSMFSENIEPKRFIKLIPSETHKADATNTIANSIGGIKARSTICESIPNSSQVTTRNIYAGANFLLTIGWQIKFGDVDITDYMKYQPHMALYKDIEMPTLAPEIRNIVNIHNLPCNIVLYNMGSIEDFSCWSYAEYGEAPSGEVIYRKFANMTNTRLYQYGRVTIDANLASFTGAVNYIKDFAAKNDMRNGLPICSNIEEIMLIVTPDSSTDTVTITNKLTTGFSFEATGSFNWMAVNVNDLLHGSLPLPSSNQ